MSAIRDLKKDGEILHDWIICVYALREKLKIEIDSFNLDCICCTYSAVSHH